MSSRNLLKEIQDMDSRDRTMESLHRRLMKLGEEYGEALQAYLDITGSKSKGLKVEDFKEEMIDIFIIVSDILSYDLPGLSLEELFDKKISKWNNQKQTRRDNVDNF